MISWHEDPVSILEARVRGVNAANAFAKELYPRLASVFAPFIGSKIEKVDGSLMQKVAKGVESLALPNGQDGKISVCRSRSNYSIVYIVKSYEFANLTFHSGLSSAILLPSNMDRGVAFNANGEYFKTISTKQKIAVAERCSKPHCYELGVYVGEIHGGFLIKLCDAPTYLRADFDAAVVLSLREAHKMAKKAAAEAETALFPFGEYDR